jgi:Putative zinc-finger
MRAEECRMWRERVGALVLDQLPEDERAATEAHLEGCPACRAEADALAPVAALLSRADPDRLAPAPAPPRHLGERIVRRISAERRARRRRRFGIGVGLAGATAAAAGAAVLAISLLGSSGGAAAREVSFRSLPRGVSAEATISPRPWGSDVSVRVDGFRPGTICRIWLRGPGGERVPAGSFRYLYAGESEEAGLSSAVSVDEATAIGLSAGSKIYVAPLGTHGPGAGASPLGRKAHQEEET